MLRQIAGKAVMILRRKDVIQAVGSPQLYAGQIAGTESAIHVIYNILKDHNTEGILLIYVENAFNSINRELILHNLEFIRLVIATYISNCYTFPVRLFIISEGELN